MHPFRNIWSAVATEGRHRFGIGRTGEDEPKRRRRFSFWFGVELIPVCARAEELIYLQKP